MENEVHKENQVHKGNLCNFQIQSIWVATFTAKVLEFSGKF